MNIPAILFLMGLSPSPNGTHEVAQQWNQLSNGEQRSIIRQFEEEYEVDMESLKNDPQKIETIKRKLNLRTHDLSL